MQDIYAAIGLNVKKMRKAKKFTQEKLADSVNSSAQYISRIERGQVCSSLDFLYKLASALGCPIYALLPSSYPTQRRFFSEEIEYQLNHCSAWKKQFLANYISWFLQQPDPLPHAVD